MSDDVESMVEERLSVFDDEPDLNDWVEVMCGAAMAVLGIFHLIQPGELINPDVMRWFSARSRSRWCRVGRPWIERHGRQGNSPLHRHS